MTHHKIRQHLEKALDIVHKMEEGSGRKHHSRKHKGYGEPSDSDDDAIEGSGLAGFKLFPRVRTTPNESGSGHAGGKKSKKSKKKNKRAEIVKKVMREKGMKMIEASKYVKQHGLY